MQEAPCTLKARRGTEGQLEAMSQLWLLYCSWDAHATLAEEEAWSQGIVFKCLHSVSLYYLNMCNETWSKM